MLVGGIFYAKRMRASGATTMIDPLQKVFFVPNVKNETSFVSGQICFNKSKIFILSAWVFVQVYGRFAGALLVIPAVMGELFWSASILAALGTTLAVILNLPG